MCMHTHTHIQAYPCSAYPCQPPSPAAKPLPNGHVGPWALGLIGAGRALYLQPPEEYCLLWVAADLISFTLIVGIFVLQK